MKISLYDNNLAHVTEKITEKHTPLPRSVMVDSVFVQNAEGYQVCGVKSDLMGKKVTVISKDGSKCTGDVISYDRSSITLLTCRSNQVIIYDVANITVADETPYVYVPMPGLNTLLSYLMPSASWLAQYIIHVSSDLLTLQRMQAKAMIKNESEIYFKNAMVSLISVGDNDESYERAAPQMMMARKAAPSVDVSEIAATERYDLKEPLSLPPYSTSNVTLFTKDNLTTNTIFEYTLSTVASQKFDSTTPVVQVTAPVNLPRGKVYIYSQGEFLTTYSQPRYSKGETVRLRLPPTPFVRARTVSLSRTNTRKEEDRELHLKADVEFKNLYKSQLVMSQLRLSFGSGEIKWNSKTVVPSTVNITELPNNTIQMVLPPSSTTTLRLDFNVLY